MHDSIVTAVDRAVEISASQQRHHRHVVGQRIAAQPMDTGGLGGAGIGGNSGSGGNGGLGLGGGMFNSAGGTVSLTAQRNAKTQPISTFGSNQAAGGGGGEYPGQDGFGWTNGVLLKLIKKYNLPKE